MSRPPADTRRYSEAVTWFRQRVPMTREEFDSLRARERGRAFTVAGVAQLDIITQVWEAMERALAEGTPLADFKREIGPQLRRAWARNQAEPAHVPSRLETIFRTNAQTAYVAGRITQLRAPAVARVLPYWMFSAVLDLRTSAICQPLHGTVLPAGHPWWRWHTPPLHHRCRSIPIGVSQAVGDEKRTQVPREVQPAEGFGLDPTQGSGWRPNLGAYPQALVEIFRRGQ